MNDLNLQAGQMRRRACCGVLDSLVGQAFLHLDGEAQGSNPKAITG